MLIGTNMQTEICTIKTETKQIRNEILCVIVT